MSLNLALLNALSGIQVTQRALDLTSQNVANVNTPGYSRKVAQQEAVVVAGAGAGVQLGPITRNVSDALLADLRRQSAAVGQSSVLDDYFGRMQDLFGTPDSNVSIGAEIGVLGDKFQAFATQPEDVSQQIAVVNQARFVSDQFNSAATQIQELRKQADAAISASVDIVKDRLDQIQSLNLEIAKDKATGQPTADLEDQRDAAVSDIAQQMDVKYFVRDNGEMVIFTESGRTLLDRTPNLLAHDATSSMSSTTTWAGGSIAPITVGGVDITHEISSGKIAALVQLRDTTLPDLASQYDELASTLHDEINAVHNQGTAYPGADVLTGSHSFALGDMPPWIGTARIAVTDSSGAVIESLDVDLATTSSINSLITAINGMTNATAQLDASGHLIIAPSGLAPVGSKIAINEMDSAVTVGSRTMGFSDFLGLNDLFTSADSYAAYTSGQQATNSTPLQQANTLTFSGAFGSTTVVYTSGNDLSDVAAAINANATLAAQNVTATVVTDGSGFRLRIADSDGDNFFIADPGGLMTTLGLKARGDGTAAQIGVRADIEANPSRVSHATLDGTSPLAVGAIGVTPGDNSTAQALADKFNESFGFGATGGISAAGRTLAGYGAAILALNSTQAATNKSTLDWRQNLYQTLSSKAASISGVNLDEETANMVLLQNAYAAAARVISTTADLFNVLQNMSR